MPSLSSPSSDVQPPDQAAPAPLAPALPTEGVAEVPRKSASARKKPAAPRNPVEAAASEAVKAAAAPRAKAARKAVAPPAVPEAPAKPAKLKLVRDSFTIPRAEYDTIAALKARALKLERSVKKSELLRAGLILLAGLGDAALLRAIDAVPQIKTGRPTKTKDKADPSLPQAGKNKSAKG